MAEVPICSVISSGAILALRAVSHGLRVPKLVLFEPPFVTNKNLIRSPNAYHDLTHLIEEGKRGEAVKFYLRKVMGVPAILPFVLQLTPNWPKMKANANSLPYDVAVCGDFEIPKNLVSAISIPVLVIDSTKSPEILRSAVEATVSALPNATRKSLKGSIHDVPPENIGTGTNRVFKRWSLEWKMVLQSNVLSLFKRLFLRYGTC